MMGGTTPIRTAQVGLLLQIRESMHGNGWASAGDTQTMLDVRTAHSAFPSLSTPGPTLSPCTTTADDGAQRAGQRPQVGLPRAQGHGERPRPRPHAPAAPGGGRERLDSVQPPCPVPIVRKMRGRRPSPQGDCGAVPHAAPPPRRERVRPRVHHAAQHEAYQLNPPFTIAFITTHTHRLLAKLPADGSEQLRALVQACNPLKTLEELGAATRIAPAQLCLLASHLVHWGYARVIPTITLRSVYAVRPAGFVTNFFPHGFKSNPHPPIEHLLMCVRSTRRPRHTWGRSLPWPSSSAFPRTTSSACWPPSARARRCRGCSTACPRYVSMYIHTYVYCLA